jgi:hypothetical protein
MTIGLKQYILDLIQLYEEMGTVESTEQYVAELTSIRDDITERLDNVLKQKCDCGCAGCF